MLSRVVINAPIVRDLGSVLADKFSQIYTTHAWGPGAEFFSGPGSHDRRVVDPYVRAVTDWLSLNPNTIVVDLGCGDFNVGHQLEQHCTYIGCDCVPSLIQYNQRRNPTVDFRLCDITIDDLPAGDIVLIRQVFQHLSNADIQLVLPKLNQYKYVIITDHMPSGKCRQPNIDIVSGVGTRVSRGSYVDITQHPHNMPYTATELCSVEDSYGILRTVLYTK